MSAVGNHTHASCNPLHKSAGATQTTTVVIGGVFTFIAIAYSTTRAATQSKAFAGGQKKAAIALGDENEIGGLGSGTSVVTTQPTPKNTPRYQALLAAVEAGAIPASALNDRGLYAEQGVDGDSDDEGDSRLVGEERDDERVEVRYNVSATLFLVQPYLRVKSSSILGSTLSLQWQPCMLPCFSQTGKL